MKEQTMRVLVTGASGFIALHCIAALLEAGYRVRGTVRSEARKAEVRESLSEHVDVANLDLMLADLTKDEGWDEAMREASYVLHVASPLPRTPPRHEDELIVPARDGALRVLEAASRAGIRRVVMTSSVAAVLYGHPRAGAEVFDESSWSNIHANIGAYEKSKTIAERAAWDFVESLEAGTAIELCTINPGLVLGPILNQDYGTSGEVVRKLMRRDFPACPDVGWAVVDVRDVAQAHIAAMTSPVAAGKRYCCAIEHASMQDIALVLKRHLEGRGYRIPTGRLPDFVLKLVAIFDKTARLAVPELGLKQHVSSTRAREELAWHPRGLDEMVGAMADSFIRYGVA